MDNRVYMKNLRKAEKIIKKWKNEFSPDKSLYGQINWADLYLSRGLHFDSVDDLFVALIMLKEIKYMMNQYTHCEYINLKDFFEEGD